MSMHWLDKGKTAPRCYNVVWQHSGQKDVTICGHGHLESTLMETKFMEVKRFLEFVTDSKQ